MNEDGLGRPKSRQNTPRVITDPIRHRSAPEPSPDRKVGHVVQQGGDEALARLRSFSSLGQRRLVSSEDSSVLRPRAPLEYPCRPMRE